MTAHDHDRHVEGCYRCDLSRDEMRHQMRTDAAAQAMHRVDCGCGTVHRDEDDLYYEMAEAALAAAAQFDRVVSE